MNAVRSVSSLMRLAAIIIVLIVGVGGWMAIRNVESQLLDSTRSATEALEQVEKSIRTSSELADATADALDAAAVSLDNAAETSEATGQVANDIANVTASLRPVVQGTGDALGQIDGTLSGVVAAIASIPFAPDIDSPARTLGQLADEIEPLEADLSRAETSLRRLSDEVDALAPDSRQLGVRLRRVATELRTSNEDLGALADDVAQTRSSVAGALNEERVNLFPLRLFLALICAAIALTNMAGLKQFD